MMISSFWKTSTDAATDGLHPVKGDSASANIAATHNLSTSRELVPTPSRTRKPRVAYFTDILGTRPNQNLSRPSATSKTSLEISTTSASTMLPLWPTRTCGQLSSEQDAEEEEEGTVNPLRSYCRKQNSPRGITGTIRSSRNRMRALGRTHDAVVAAQKVARRNRCGTVEDGCAQAQCSLIG